MDTPSSQDRALLSRFEQHLIDGGYTRPVVAHHLDITESFLKYLRQASLAGDGR